MKKIETGSNKHIIVFGVSAAIAGMILYPIFDIILCKFITNSEFVYSVHEYIIQPIIFGLFLSLLLYVGENGLKIKK